jgi:hypothetical protein
LRAQGLTQQQIVPIVMNPTVLSADSDGARPYIDPTSMCPNGITYKVNSDNRTPWEQLLRARDAPPKPPPCVPSQIAPCNALLPSGRARFIAKIPPLPSVQAHVPRTVPPPLWDEG